jgi:hypothetical protein
VQKFVELTGERLVIGALCLDGMLVRLHFIQEIMEGRPCLGAMLAVLVPIARPKSQENADRDEDNLDQQAGKASGM